MASMYDSGLFSELGDLLGHDPNFYEESDVSSFTGDIMKHSFNTPLGQNSDLNSNGSQVPEFFQPPPAAGFDEIDSLLSEGNMLLDKLMAENGLSLLSSPVELADVDELITGENKFAHAAEVNADPSVNDMFSQYYKPANEIFQQPPISPVSTLPSEPSSPVDLFSLESASFSAEPAPVSPPENDVNNDLDYLLSSLMDDNTGPSESSNFTESFDEQYAYSPTSSSCSGSDEPYSPSGGDDDDTKSIDDSSSCSSGPSPTKVKASKKKKSSTPYSKLPANRKEKKKLQNKEAAIRYRQKKKSEMQVLVDEETELQEKNDGLRSEVLNLEREIMCMKELLSDVFNIHSI